MTYPEGTSAGHGVKWPVRSGVESHGSSPDTALPSRPVWFRLAGAFTIAFMLLHVYWAVGGTWGLPLGALQWQAALQGTNWVVSALMLIGACWVLALHHRLARRVPAWLVLTPVWIGAVVCVSHAVYGFLTKALYLGGVQGAVDFPHVSGFSAATVAERHHLSAVQDLLVFEPCFLLQGVLLALAGRQFIQSEKGRRTWWVSMTVSLVAVDVFGTLLALVGMHVTIN